MPHTLSDRLLEHLHAHYQGMPPVAAMQVAIAGFDGERLRLRAPLSHNVNDKGCAFGGSLASLMTLAAWGVATMKIQGAGMQADVFVADSQVRYLAPLYADLDASARLSDGDWDAVRAALREKGRASMVLQAEVAGADGTVAASGRARYVAIARTDAGTDARTSEAAG